MLSLSDFQTLQPNLHQFKQQQQPQQQPQRRKQQSADIDIEKQTQQAQQSINNNNNITIKNSSGVKLRRNRPMCRGKPRPLKAARSSRPKTISSSSSSNNNNNTAEDDGGGEGGENDEDAPIVFMRRPSAYLLLEPETILLFRLAGMKLKPSQQERLYWNVLHLLNSLEHERKGLFLLSTSHSVFDIP